MNIEFTGRHIRVTPALRSHASERLHKIARYIDEAQKAHVILEVSKHRHIAEVVLVGKREKLSGQGETEDMYASLNLVLDRIERQAKKQRKKLIESKRRRPSKARTRREEPAEVEPVAEEPSEGQIAVIHADPVVPKLLSIEEALLALEDATDGFVLFRDKTSERLNLLYRRPDGRFSLLEPQG